MSFANVGKVWDAVSFREHVKGLDLSWATGITMHHTAAPSLEQRPRGLTIQHIRNIQDFYQNEKQWSRGPHLFIDDDEIFGMSPLTERGVHAKSFNSSHIGIEVLGDYDEEDPNSGRGLSCWQTAAQAVAILIELHPHLKQINGHRDDPRTSKSCPGKKVDLDAFRLTVYDLLKGKNEEPKLSFPPRLKERLEAIEWQLKQIRKGVGL
jgi:hypothetical protein